MHIPSAIALNPARLITFSLLFIDESNSVVKRAFFMMRKSVMIIADRGITNAPNNEMNCSASSTSAGNALNAIAHIPSTIALFTLPKVGKVFKRL